MNNTKRGEQVTVSGVTGWYVGERAGVLWIAYSQADFATMCVAFDSKS